jgi:hypothetical protein
MKLLLVFITFLVATHMIVCKPSSFVTRPSTGGFSTQLEFDQTDILTDVAAASLQGRCLLPFSVGY